LDRVTPNGSIWDSQLADPTNNYLYQWGYPPEQIAFNTLIQQKFARPLLYPFYNTTTGQWRSAGPVYWQALTTDANGQVTFTLSRGQLQDIYDFYPQVTGHAITSLEEIALYMRVFFDPTVTSSSMKVPNFDAFTAANTVYLPSASVYHAGCATLPPTADPMVYAFRPALAEGIVQLLQDDTMFYTATNDISTPGQFDLFAMIVEADVNNGTLVLEPSENTVYSTLRQRQNQSMLVELEVWDTYNRTLLIGPYYAWAEDSGLISHSITEFSRLIPGVYNLHYRCLFNNHTYYRTPPEHWGQFVLRSQYSQALDSPSVLYPLATMLRDAQATVLTAGQNITYTAFESYMPRLSGEVWLRNTTVFPENYNNSETAVMTISVNGIPMKSFSMSGEPDLYNMTDYLNDPDVMYSVEMINATHGYDSWVPFDLPLSAFLGQQIRIELTAAVYADVYANVNFTMINASASAQAAQIYSVPNPIDYAFLGVPTGTNLTVEEYRELWIDATINAYYEQQAALFAMDAGYEIRVRNLTLRENSVSPGQRWNLLREFMPLIWSGDYSYQAADTGQTWNSTKGVLYDGFYTGSNCSQLHSEFTAAYINSEYRVTIPRTGLNFSAPIFLNTSLLGLPPVEWTMPSWSWVAAPGYTDNATVVTFGEAIVIESPTLPYFSGDHGIFAGQLQSPTELTDVLAFGLSPAESVRLRYTDLYIPYKGKLKMQVILPETLNPSLTTADLNALSINLTVSPRNMLEKIALPVNLTALTLVGTEWQLNLDYEFPASLTSHYVTFDLAVGVTGSADHAVKILLKTAQISGREFFIQTSSMVPVELRQRMFSSNFFYLYVLDAFKMGATRNEGGVKLESAVINDIHLRLTGDLATYMSVWDEGRFATMPGIKSAEDLPYIFHNDTNTESFYELEFGGAAMFRLKYNDAALDALTAPSAWSGIATFSNVVGWLPSGQPDLQQLTDFRITASVNPTFYHQYISSTEVLPGQTIKTSGLNATLTGYTGVDYEVDLAYTMKANATDLVVEDWGQRIWHPNREPLPYNDKDEFYDERNYRTALDWLDIAGTYNGQTIDAKPYLPLEGPNVILPSQLEPDQPEFAGHAYQITCPVLFDAYPGTNAVLVGLHTYNASGFSALTVRVGYPNPDNPNTRLFATATKTALTDNTDYQLAVTLPAQASKVTEIIIEGNLNGTYYTTFNYSEGTPFYPSLGFRGFALIKDSSVGHFTLNPYHPIYKRIEAPLYPTLFASDLLPETVKIPIPLSNGTEIPLDAMFISAPANQTVHLFDLSIKARNISTEESLFTKYQWSFDENTQKMTALMRLYTGQAAWPAWTTLMGAPVTFRASPVMDIYYFDYNGDGVYDYGERYLDADGGGFGDGLKDYTAFDFGADGIWDYEVMFDLSETVYVTANATEFGGVRQISCMRRTSVTEFYDTNADGMYDEVIEEYRTISADPIPEHRLWYAYTGQMRSHTWVYSGTEIYGQSLSRDSNHDGIPDLIIDRQDRLDDEALMIDIDEDYYYEYTYESWQQWTRTERPIYNASSADPANPEIIGWEPVTEYLHGNYLAANYTLRLEGLIPWVADAGLWTGTEDPIYTGEFIKQTDVPVIIDPRTYMLVGDIDRGMIPAGVDPHGNIYWADLNNDSVYETGFITSSLSEYAGPFPHVIAIYLDQSGEMRMPCTPEYISQGVYLPLYWLSDPNEMQKLVNQSWVDARNEYFAYMRSTQGIIMTVLDTVVAGLAAAASAIATAAASAVLTPIAGRIVGFIVTMAVYSIYQEHYRGKIEDWLNKHCGADPGTEYRTLAKEIKDYNGHEILPQSGQFKQISRLEEYDLYTKFNWVPDPVYRYENYIACHPTFTDHNATVYYAFPRLASLERPKLGSFWDLLRDGIEGFPFMNVITDLLTDRFFTTNVESYYDVFLGTGPMRNAKKTWNWSVGLPDQSNVTYYTDPANWIVLAQPGILPTVEAQLTAVGQDTLVPVASETGMVAWRVMRGPVGETAKSPLYDRATFLGQYVDMNALALSSLYQTEKAYASAHDAAITGVNFAISLVHILVSVTVSFGLQRLFAQITAQMTGTVVVEAAGKTFLEQVVGETIEELYKEQLVQVGLLMLGVDEKTANWLAEAIISGTEIAGDAYDAAHGQTDDFSSPFSTPEIKIGQSTLAQQRMGLTAAEAKAAPALVSFSTRTEITADEFNALCKGTKAQAHRNAKVTMYLQTKSLAMRYLTLVVNQILSIGHRNPQNIQLKFNQLVLIAFPEATYHHRIQITTNFLFHMAQQLLANPGLTLHQLLTDPATLTVLGLTPGDAEILLDNFENPDIRVAEFLATHETLTLIDPPLQHNLDSTNRRVNRQEPITLDTWLRSADPNEIAKVFASRQSRIELIKRIRLQNRINDIQFIEEILNQGPLFKGISASDAKLRENPGISKFNLHPSISRRDNLRKTLYRIKLPSNIDPLMPVFIKDLSIDSKKGTGYLEKVQILYNAFGGDYEVGEWVQINYPEIYEMVKMQNNGLYPEGYLPLCLLFVPEINGLFTYEYKSSNELPTLFVNRDSTTKFMNGIVDLARKIKELNQIYNKHGLHSRFYDTNKAYDEINAIIGKIPGFKVKNFFSSSSMLENFQSFGEWANILGGFWGKRSLKASKPDAIFTDVMEWFSEFAYNYQGNPDGQLFPPNGQKFTDLFNRFTSLGQPSSIKMNLNEYADLLLIQSFIEEYVDLETFLNAKPHYVSTFENWQVSNKFHENNMHYFLTDSEFSFSTSPISGYRYEHSNMFTSSQTDLVESDFVTVRFNLDESGQITEKYRKDRYKYLSPSNRPFQMDIDNWDFPYMRHVKESITQNEKYIQTADSNAVQKINERKEQNIFFKRLMNLNTLESRHAYRFISKYKLDPENGLMQRKSRGETIRNDLYYSIRGARISGAAGSKDVNRVGRLPLREDSKQLLLNIDQKFRRLLPDAVFQSIVTDDRIWCDPNSIREIWNDGLLIDPYTMDNFVANEVYGGSSSEIIYFLKKFFYAQYCWEAGIPYFLIKDNIGYYNTEYKRMAAIFKYIGTDQFMNLFNRGEILANLDPYLKLAWAIVNDAIQTHYGSTRYRISDTPFISLSQFSKMIKEYNNIYHYFVRADKKPVLYDLMSIFLGGKGIIVNDYRLGGSYRTTVDVIENTAGEKMINIYDDSHNLVYSINLGIEWNYYYNWINHFGEIRPHWNPLPSLSLSAMKSIHYSFGFYGTPPIDSTMSNYMNVAYGNLCWDYWMNILTQISSQKGISINEITVADVLSR
jgi:hypothetical protein